MIALERRSIRKCVENMGYKLIENDKCKVLWDFTVLTDHEIYGRRPDVIVVQKEKSLCQIIDFACPYDRRVDTMELEKMKNYQDLT